MTDQPPGPWSRPPAWEPEPQGRGAATSAADSPEPGRERVFNTPWIVPVLSGFVVAAFFWQLNAPDTGALINRYGFTPAAFSAGRWEGLLGHIFLHGGWLHLFMNTTALLAFGTPVARLYGAGPGGAVRFLLFFLLCGVAGALAFWGLNPGGEIPAVGASGAISGLMGGAARLVEARGRLSGPFSRSALGFVVPWVAINLAIAVAGVAFGLPIAWEAHLGGLAAGLLTAGLFAPRSAGAH